MVAQKLNLNFNSSLCSNFTFQTRFFSHFNCRKTMNKPKFIVKATVQMDLMSGMTCLGRISIGQRMIRMIRRKVTIRMTAVMTDVLGYDLSKRTKKMKMTASPERHLPKNHGLLGENLIFSQRCPKSILAPLYKCVNYETLIVSLDIRERYRTFFNLDTIQ